MAGNWKMACLMFVLIIQTHGQDNDEIPLTLITNAVAKGAVCIDGSSAGYHYASGFGGGTDNWLIYLMGGGWCVSSYDCYARSTGYSGSTINVTSITFAGMLSSNGTINPDFYSWNKICVHYCDGSSFIGDSELLYSGSNLQLRGSRIFNAVMDELLAKGMKNANNAILAGGSAGGLATILNCDRFRTYLPNSLRVKCVSDAGFFIRGNELPYHESMGNTFADIIKIHNLSFILPTSCTKRLNSSLCLFPQYLLGDIQTPLFLVNSIFDSYQIQTCLHPDPANDTDWGTCTKQVNSCTYAQKQVIKDFGNAFLEALQETGNNPSRGMFIHACYSHIYVEFSEMWNSKTVLRLENKTISQAIGDWFFDRDSVQLVDTKTDFPLNCKCHECCRC